MKHGGARKAEIDDFRGSNDERQSEAMDIAYDNLL